MVNDLDLKQQNLRARAQRIAQTSRELSAQIDLLQGGGGEDAAENGSERAAAVPKSQAVRAGARLSTRHRATKQRLMALQQEQEQEQAQRRLLAESGWAEGGAGRQHGGDVELWKLEAEYMEAIAAAENSDEDVAAAAAAAEREAGHSESHARCGIDGGRGGDGGGHGNSPVATLALSVAIGLLALACGYALWWSLIAHVGDVARSHWLPLPAARLELPLVLRWWLPTPEEDWGKFSVAGLWRAVARRLFDFDDGSAGDVGTDNEEL